VVSECWTAVPDKPNQRIPTSASAVQAIEKALLVARNADGIGEAFEEELVLFARTCAWARQLRFSGSWSTVVGAAAAVIAFLAIGRDGDRLTLGLSLIWAISIPLYLRAATLRQYQINARVVAGTQTLDDRFLSFVASGAPLMVPVWMALRASVLGALAPLLAIGHLVRRFRS